MPGMYSSVLYRVQVMPFLAYKICQECMDVNILSFLPNLLTTSQCTICIHKITYTLNKHTMSLQDMMSNIH